MLFNSIDFAFFLPIVFILYWFVTNRNLKAQNLLLLIASYFFYGWWDWRCLLLLIIISTSNYFVGKWIDRNDLNNKKKIWFTAGLVINIGILGIFKYYNFFVDSFVNLISLFGYNLSKASANIVLPLGISFYTFLSLSYLIDIYKKNLDADRNIIEVLLTLSFFPIILAGPIQRPSSLLPQIAKKRVFIYDQAVDGLRQILWGLFTKIVIADKLALHVDDIFHNVSAYSGSTLLIGIIFYSLQIYADFSGYSNIAIGIGKIFGFNLMQNFAYPYFSRDITEFWKRWHISLTTWFRDYIFLPISFNVSWIVKNDRVIFIKTEMFIYIVASIITWFLTGLWHGANFTFIIWGMIHGFFLIIYQWQKSPRKKLFKKFGITNKNPIVIIIETLITLIIVMIAWVFFRSSTIHQANLFIAGIFSSSLFSFPQCLPKKVILITILFILAEWLQRNKQYALQVENVKYRIVRWGIYYGIIVLIFLSLGDSQQSFIYSKF